MKLKQKFALKYFSMRLKALELVNIQMAAKAAFTLLCTPYTRKRSYDLPPIFKLGERLSFSFEEHTIHGIRWKPARANGRKILICHGFDSASYKFAHYIKPLSDAGFEIFAFDAPAHGLSTGKTINVLTYCNFILSIFKQYGYADGIMAHSFGGVAAALALEQIPEGIIKRMVLMAPATETKQSINDFCKALHLSKKLQHAIESLILTIGGKPVDWYSVSRVIQKVKTPTLWIHDRKDAITPFADVEHLTTKEWPHLTFHITEGLGHSVYNNEAVAKKIILFMESMIQHYKQ